MTNLKKYNVLLQHFVLFLTFILLAACAHQKYSITNTDSTTININKTYSEDTAIERYIKPYKAHLDKDLNTVLAYAPENIDKNGQWQSTLGNLFADITLQKCNLIFNSREKKSIDICLLNHGGLRSIISKGSVTTKTAYEIMPFENSAQVLALKGLQIKDITTYILKEKKPHPLAGMIFTIKNGNSENIQIQGKPLELDKIYYVVTSDYLANGGDNMTFFKEAVKKYDLDYKLRNVLIDYFTETDTIPVIRDQRILLEN
jgi:2',3'-cyclic-nucleotide 2'-phosphodiesterase (5'-nucleotidase family)